MQDVRSQTERPTAAQQAQFSSTTPLLPPLLMPGSSAGCAHAAGSPTVPRLLHCWPQPLSSTTALPCPWDSCERHPLSCSHNPLHTMSAQQHYNVKGNSIEDESQQQNQWSSSRCTSQAQSTSLTAMYRQPQCLTYTSALLFPRCLASHPPLVLGLWCSPKQKQAYSLGMKC